MKQTIIRATSSIIALAGEIGIEAETLPDDAGTIVADCVNHLHEAERALNQARGALRLALANRSGESKPATPEQDYRAEAERLAQLPRDDQRRLIAQHRAIADDEDVPTPARTEAKDRADALEMHLQRLDRKKR